MWNAFRELQVLKLRAVFNTEIYVESIFHKKIMIYLMLL